MTPKKKALPASLICSVLICVFFLVLVFLPDALRKRRESYPLSTAENTQLTRFPVDTPLPLIQNKPGQATASVLALMGGNPNGAIVNFWATWCPPCLEELPGLEYLNRELRASRAHLPGLITISVDNEPGDVIALYKTLDFTPSFLVLHDRDGTLSRSVGTTKFPETYWVAPDGAVLYKWIGPQNWLSSDVVQRLASLAKH